MEYRFIPARVVKGETVGAEVHEFWKMNLVRVKAGQNAGRIIGTQRTAHCLVSELGNGASVLSVKELEGVLAGSPVIRKNRHTGRVDISVVKGGGENEFTEAELKEMLAKVKPEEKRGPGRPKKDD